MIQRSNVTWDLSRAGHTLTAYWTQPSEKPSVPARVHSRFERDDAPWEPWQISGIITALRAGVELSEVAPGPKPHMTALRTLIVRAGDTFITALDRLTTGRSLEGGRP